MTQKLEFKEIETDKEDNFRVIVVKNKKGEHLGHLTNEFWNRWTWEQNKDILMSRGCFKQVMIYWEELGGKD